MEKNKCIARKDIRCIEYGKTRGAASALRREAVLNNGFLSEKQQMTKKRYLYGKIISCRIYHFIYN